MHNGSFKRRADAIRAVTIIYCATFLAYKSDLVDCCLALELERKNR